MDALEIKKELKKLANRQKAEQLARFFKTGKGEYGEGDTFLGVVVPQQRKIAKKYKSLSLTEVKKLLSEPFHECRLTALLLLTYKYAASPQQRQEIYEFYLANIDHIDNWDLIDTTAPKIIGAYLSEQKEQRKVLYTLARSEHLWYKRIAILSTFTFIKQGEFTDTLAIAEILLHDCHDLIHKAVGWMLREVGKADQKTAETFLQKHYRDMPRTMLRYAIEKFSPQQRQFYLQR